MSISIDVTTEIDRPVEEVFEFVTAVENDELWMGPILDTPPMDEAMDVGTTWSRTVDGPFGTEEIVMECTAIERPTRYSYQTVSGFVNDRINTQEEFTFTGDGESTRLELSSTVDVSGLLKLLQPILAKMIRKDVNSSQADLKALLEQAADPTPDQA